MGISNYDFQREVGCIFAFRDMMRIYTARGCINPYFGFFHTTHTSFQALVYDLIEPFRWLVEYAVYKLAVEEPTHGRMIKKSEYAWTREVDYSHH